MQNEFLKIIFFIIFSIYCALTGCSQSLSLLKNKAMSGDAGSQMFLGLCYQEGKQVEKNDSLAVYWFEKSARQGLAEAQVMLGNCYREGIWVQKDSVKAYELYEQASWCGASLALDALGDCYYYGIGVERDVIRARHFYSRAATRGYAKSKMKFSKIRYEKQDDIPIEF